MANLDAIVEAHSDAVWRTAYRLLNHFDDARDCHQETFLAAMRLAAGKEVRNWQATLLAIATRRAIDRLRARYREQTAREAHSGHFEPTATEPPAAQVEWGELREQVRMALATLPPQQAEAFWLRHLEQFTVDQVAEQMAIEPGHVRVLVHRAAVALRGLLGPSYGPASLSGELP